MAQAVKKPKTAKDWAEHLKIQENFETLERLLEEYRHDLDLDAAVDALIDGDKKSKLEATNVLNQVSAIIDKEEFPHTIEADNSNKKKSKAKKKAKPKTAKKRAAVKDAFSRVADAISNIHPVGKISVQGLRATSAFTKHSIQTVPQIVFAAATVAALAGNIDPETQKAVDTFCAEKSLSICGNAHLFERLSNKDRLLLTAMLQTTNNSAEESAISAIGAAAAKTNVDLTFLLAFAHLESSLGKLQSASTSSAQGIFQYTQSTWLESFQKHAGSYSSEYSDLASAIKKIDGNYVVSDSASRQMILDLRIDDPDLHAFIAAKDIAQGDGTVLSSYWNTDQSEKAHDLVAAAQSVNMGRAAQAFVDIWNDIQSITSQDMDARTRDALLDHKSNQFVEKVMDAYLEHFLGDSGARRFMSLYNDKDNALRYKPVSNLMNESNAVSSRAVNANGGIFLNGNASVVEVYEIIKAKVENSFGLMDARLASHLESQQTQIVAVLKDGETIPVPMPARPRRTS